MASWPEIIRFIEKEAVEVAGARWGFSLSGHLLR